MGSFYHFASPNPGTPMPSEKKKSRATPVYSFTWFDVLVVVVSMGTYLADIVTDILVTLVYWRLDEKIWAGLTLAFLILPSIIMQIFSTRWYVADGHKATFSMFLIHILMMGPIKRYVAVLRHGIRAKRTKRIEDYQAMYSELSDVSMLRLFESFLESAPQLVLQLYIMIEVTEDDHILTGIAAFFSLISLAWAIASYTKALRTAAYSQDSRKKRVSWSGLALQTLWRVGMVAGRIVALVMFATAFPVWLLGGVGVHWFVMAVWLIAQDTDFCGTWWEEKLFNAVVGVIHIFCFFNMKEGRSRWRMLFFYGLVFAENSAMIIMWFPHRTIGAWYNIPALIVVWGGFAIGLASMLLYYRYFHPSSVKRCHCCMLYYHLVYRCCPCHDVTTFEGTPYRRNIGALDDGDFSEQEDFFAFRGFQDVGDELELDNHDMMEYSTPGSLHRDFCRETRGMNVRSFDQNPTKKTDKKKFLMPNPKLTSTPADDLDDRIMKISSNSQENLNKYENDEEISLTSVSKSSKSDRSVEKNSRDRFVNDDTVGPLTLTPSVLKNLPGGHTGPGTSKGNSTLVRQWVKKTQEIYKERNGAEGRPEVSFADIAPASDFETLRFAKKDEREFMQIHFGDINAQPSGRRDILRLKSFSKKDREQPPKLLKKRKRGSYNVTDVRNTFREAFGFYTFDKDKSDVSEFDAKVKKIVRKQPKRRLKTKNTWGASEIDHRDSIKEDKVARKSDFSAQNEVKPRRQRLKVRKNKPASVHMILARIDQPPELLNAPHVAEHANKVKYKRESAAIEVFDSEGAHEIPGNFANDKLCSSNAKISVYNQEDIRASQIRLLKGTSDENVDVVTTTDWQTNDLSGEWRETDLDHSRHLKKLGDSVSSELSAIRDVQGPETAQKTSSNCGRNAPKSKSLLATKLWNTPKKIVAEASAAPKVKDMASCDATMHDSCCSSEPEDIDQISQNVKKALKAEEKSVYDNLTASLLLWADETDAGNARSSNERSAGEERVNVSHDSSQHSDGGKKLNVQDWEERREPSGDMFGAVIQIRGDRVTVQHRDGGASENLELISNPASGENQTQKQESLISNPVFQPSRLRENLTKLISHPAPDNKETKENVLISDSEFQPCGGVKRAEISKAPIRRDRIEYLYKVGRQGLMKAAENSPARKRLSFKKLAKISAENVRFSHSLESEAKNAVEDAENAQIFDKNDPNGEKKMENSIEALGESMEDVIEGGENYKIHIRHRMKNGRKPSSESLKNHNVNSRKPERERRTLGAIENRS